MQLREFRVSGLLYQKISRYFLAKLVQRMSTSYVKVELSLLSSEMLVDSCLRVF